MPTTTFLQPSPTLALDKNQPKRCPDVLLERYRQLVAELRLSWTEHLRLLKRLGSGGQGVVYLSERRGTDNFTLPVALKIFSPLHYEDDRSYDEAMLRIAGVAARVAQIQQDNLLDVHNFVERNRIRLMEMEWVDGYDLDRLLTHEMLERTRQRVSNRRWEYLNNVIVTGGRLQPRLKPGIAIAVLRECLAPWPRCTARGLSITTSNPRTSCSSGRATPRSSTSAQRSIWKTLRRAAVAHRHMPLPRCSKGPSPRHGPICAAWAMC